MRRCSTRTAGTCLCPNPVRYLCGASGAPVGRLPDAAWDSRHAHGRTPQQPMVVSSAMTLYMKFKGVRLILRIRAPHLPHRSIVNGVTGVSGVLAQSALAKNSKKGTSKYTIPMVGNHAVLLMRASKQVALGIVTRRYIVIGLFGPPGVIARNPAEPGLVSERAISISLTLSMVRRS